MRSIPSANIPVVNPSTGVLTPEWFKHFAGRNADAGKFSVLTVTTSPFVYTANVSGHLLVNGGTVSGVSLTRARISLATGVISGFVPMAAGDVVSITYSALPAVTFIPE